MRPADLVFPLTASAALWCLLLSVFARVSGHGMAADVLTLAGMGGLGAAAGMVMRKGLV